MERRARIALAALVAAGAALVIGILLVRPATEHLTAGAWPTEVDGAPAGMGVALEDTVGAPSADGRAPSTPIEAIPQGPARETLAVSVVDASKRPLSGARVRCSSVARTVEETTDAAGRALLPLSAGDLRARVSVEKPGYFHAERDVNTAYAVQLSLHRAIALTGRVEDQTSGDPIAGAELAFKHLDCGGCPPERAFSDGDGAFHFEAVPAGRTLELEAQAEGYMSARVKLAPDAQAAAAEQDLRLSRGLAITLTVIDAQTRAPIEGAAVRGVRGPFVTDGAGRVASDQLVSPSLARNDLRARLDVAAAGYCQLTVFPSVGELAAARELILPLVRSVTVEGSVQDAAGRSAGAVELAWDADFRFEAKGENAPGAARLGGELLATWFAELPPWVLGRERRGSDPRFRSAADGSFTLHGAVPWTPDFTLMASAPGGTRGAASLALPGPGETARVAIELQSGSLPLTTAVIRGKLTLNGAAEKGRVHWRGATRQGTGPADKRGAFELSDVEPGGIALRVESERLVGRGSCPLAELDPHSVFTVAGEVLEHDIDIALPLAAISGRVLDSAGAPVAGALVDAHDLGHCWHERAATDEQGRYALAAPAGLDAIFEVAVERAPERLVRRAVPPGAEDVDFVLAALGRLRFRVLDEGDGSIIRRGTLHWRRPGSPSQELAELERLVPEPGGWYVVACASGQLELVMQTGHERGAALVSQSAAIYPGATTVAEFRILPRLDLRVVFDQGSIPPPEGFTGVVVPEGLWNQIRYTLDPRPRWDGLGKTGPFDELHFKSNGTAVARGLRPGSYRFKVWPENVRIEPERLELSGNEPEVTVLTRLEWR